MSISPETLRQTSKAKLKYDRNWCKDGRLSEILVEISGDERLVSLHPFCLPLTARRSTIDEVQKNTTTESSSDTLCVYTSSIISRNNSQDHDELPNMFKTELEIAEYERQQMLKIQERVQCKREAFDRFWRLLYDKSLLKLDMLRERQRFVDDIRERELEAETEAGQDEMNRRHEKLVNDHASFAKMSDERLKEASLRDIQEEEEALKRVELRQKIGTLATCKQHVSATYQQIVTVIRSCQNLHLVPEDVRTAVQSMNEVVTDVQKILDRVRTGIVDDSDLELMRRLETKTNTCHEIIKLGVELANKAAQIENNRPSDDGKVISSSIDQLSTTTPVIVSTGTLKRYSNAMDTLNNAVESYGQLSSNIQLKSYRAAFKVAINAPVNAISAQSGSQLYDKLKRLVDILSGNQVELTNGRRFSVDEHQQGKIFCMDLLAKKFVNQGECAVSANKKAAFPLAVVILGLWKKFPVFGELLLAHFYVKCPYLVPYNVPKIEGQSDIEYQSILGYKTVDGVLEQTDKFLDRMSGIVRVYAAVIQSPLLRDVEPTHPHGVEYAWRWLTCTLSMDPLPDITATVLYDFLEVCGNMLQKSYGKQFHKLLLTLSRDYLPRIKAVTPIGSGGPTGRLETFLMQWQSRVTIAEPEGILPPNFWST